MRNEDEDTGRESRGIDLEATIAGKYRCPQCGRDAVHEIVSNYHECEHCGFDYGMRARDFFEREAERIPAEAKA